MSNREQGDAWQIGVWDRMSELYGREIDRRFAPVIDRVIASADLRAGEHVLDLGTGTGAVAEKAAPVVEPGGSVLAIDISPEMLAVAQQRAGQASITFQVAEGSAESIPAADASLDVILASLSLMYVIDRPRAAREMARVLRPGGRLAASAWAGLTAATSSCSRRLPAGSPRRHRSRVLVRAAWPIRSRSSRLARRHHAHVETEPR